MTTFGQKGLIAGLGAVAIATQASVVNIDVNAYDSNANANRQGTLYAGQGAYSDEGNDYWNGISIESRSRFGLLASDGSSITPLSITVTGGGGFVDTVITNDLLSDYFYGATTATIGGLSPGEAYTVYVYAVGDQPGQGSAMTINGVTRSTTGSNVNEFVADGNYVVFATSATASGELIIESSEKVNGYQIVGGVSDPGETFTTQLVHPGMSHKMSDLERMKYQVEAKVDPWYSSYQTMIQDGKASYSYAVRGNTNMTVIYRDSPGTNKSEFESDSRAAYYNAIRWIVEGDSRYADKAVEIFNAWTGLTYVQHSGTQTLSGSMVYVMLEAAEIIKSTYPGWSEVDITKFGDMLVYPGWSSDSIPADLTTQGSWYWRVYKGDRARAGNQELSGWRACMAIGIFLDNEIIYDRAMRYVAGMDHRPDDLAYEPGPNIVDYAFTSTPYNVAYRHIELSSYPDWGFDGVLTNYIYETGQCAEAARDQGHCQWGLNCLKSIAEMAWNQGDDLWGLEENRLLLGLEYHNRYNLSFLQSYPDQSTPWEPTVASGEFVQRLNRVARTKCLAINPYFEYDASRYSRGAVSGDQWELAVGHYVGHGFSDPTDDAKWITRTRDYNIAQNGYEQTDNGGAYIGWGGLTFRRPDECYGDPISGFVSNAPVFAMNHLPGTLELVNYDYATVSGEGRTFHDTSPSNSLGQYRNDGHVDIGVCSEGGYAVTDLASGEWMSYTVYVPEAGKHKLEVRHAGGAGGVVRVSMGGVDVTGEVLLPATGGTNSWATHPIADNLSIDAGVQSLRVYYAGAADACDLKSVTLTPVQGVADPVTRIQAEDCLQSSGLNLSDPCSDVGGGLNVGSISDGDWCRYGIFALGQNAKIRFRLARPSGRVEGRVEVRLGSAAGTLVGSMNLVVTGGWQTWETFEVGLDPVVGSQELYLVFRETASPPQGGDMGNLNWLELVIPAPPVAPEGLAASPHDASQINVAWNPVEGASTYRLKRATASGGPYVTMGLGPTHTNVADVGLFAGTNYFYVVSALFDGAESADSIEVSAVPSAPLNEGDVIIGPIDVLEDGSGGLNFAVSIAESELGHNYQVMRSDRLTDPLWTPASKVIPGDGGALIIELPIGADTNLFYRLDAWRQ